jgi:hypothetical protein
MIVETRYEGVLDFRSEVIYGNNNNNNNNNKKKTVVDELAMQKLSTRLSNNETVQK